MQDKNRAFLLNPFGKIIAVLGCVCLVLYYLNLIMSGTQPVTVRLICLVTIVFLLGFAYVAVNPDSLRSVFTEQTLSTASDTLADIEGGLTPEAAEAVCRRLLPETRAMAIAITDDANVLAYVGQYEADFPAGSPIHTPATKYVLEHGRMRTFTTNMQAEGGRGMRFIPAGIVEPLKVRGVPVGTLKFYYKSARHLDRTQYALASGFAELLSTQLAIHELEKQSELTARAELKALQAQINPHFLFNTLNTIAAFTRTDPLRARELLREFASFYRSTLENSSSLIPLSKELVQTRRYLTFEKARFGEDRIVDSYDVADGLDEALVPAFIIQPIVENAVRHAMRDEGALHIRVEASKCPSADKDGDGAVVIRVSDDGLGMDEDVAASLFDPSSPHKGEGTGVAMWNISERVRRFYGPGSYVRADSRPGEGTTFTLRLEQGDYVQE